MRENSFDLIVVGAGPTGENVAQRAVKAGLSVAIVESGLVGGECSYYACIPSKVLLRSSAAREAARRVEGAKEAVTGPLDASAVLARRTRMVKNWTDDDQAEWLNKKGIMLLRGRGRIAGECIMEVTGNDGAVARFTARHAVAICTGTDPDLPPIPGLAEASPWTNREATRADRVPGRLAILGGGPEACELAQAWRSLGAKEVTILERADRLLERMEPFVGDRIAAAFRSIGISVHTEINVTRVQRRTSASPSQMASPVQIWFENPKTGPASIETDEILVATGRVPNTRDIGLDSVQLKPGTWLDVDDTCRVKGIAAGWLYAVGDVNHRALLTHMGKYQARACGDAIAARAKGELKEPPGAASIKPSIKPWSRWSTTADHAAVPQVIFTDPEVAAVGLTEAKAREAGLSIRAIEYDLSHITGGQLVADGYQGQAKMIVDENRRVIVGATLVGQDVGEMIHAFTIAIVGEVPLERLWHAVPCFPTISEIWLRLLESYGL